MVQTQLLTSDAKFRGWFCFSTILDAFHLHLDKTSTLTWSLLTRIYIKHTLQNSIKIPTLALGSYLRFWRSVDFHKTSEDHSDSQA